MKNISKLVIIGNVLLEWALIMSKWNQLLICLDMESLD